MININNYILEKLHLSKDTKYRHDKEIKKGDKVLYFMLRDDEAINTFFLDYCKITSIDQNGIDLKSLTDGKMSYSVSKIEKNSKKIYEKNCFWRGKSTGYNLIILKDEDALDFLNTILRSEDYKKIDYTKWIDGDIHIPSNFKMNIYYDDIQEIKYKIRHQND